MSAGSMPRAVMEEMAFLDTPSRPSWCHSRHESDPQDLAGAALRLLEYLVDSEDRCERLQGRLQEARGRIARLEFQISELEEQRSASADAALAVGPGSSTLRNG
jgi:hypothetical protein